MTIGTTIGLGIVVSILILAFVLGITIAVIAFARNDDSFKDFIAGGILTIFSGTVLFTIGTAITLAIMGAS